MTAPRQATQLCTTIWRDVTMSVIRCDSNSARKASPGCSISGTTLKSNFMWLIFNFLNKIIIFLKEVNNNLSNFKLNILTCSKISASSEMNLICSLELHLMLRYGSSVIACSTIRCGRICAKEWRAVMQPTSRAMFDFSYSITKLTKPLTICWHERTSTGEISFLPFVSSFTSFGSKTYREKSFMLQFNVLIIFQLILTVFSSPWKAFSCDESSTSIIWSHLRRIPLCKKREISKLYNML